MAVQFALPGAKSDAGTAEVTKTRSTKAHDGVPEQEEVISQEAEQVEVEGSAAHGGEPMAEVSYGLSQRVPIAKYTTVEVHVGLRLPTPVEELDESYDSAKGWVEARFEAEMADVQSQIAGD